MTKVFFVGDTGNRLNWGCRATTHQLRGLIGRFAEITAALDPAYPWHLLKPGSAPVRPPRISPAKVLLRSAARPLFPLALRLNPFLIEKASGTIDAIPLSGFETLLRDAHHRPAFRHIVEAVEAADVMVLNGEGALMGNRGRLLLLLAYMARTHLGKPAIMVNHCADFRLSALHRAASLVYPLLDDTVVRDRFSLACAGTLRRGRPLVFAPDAAFLSAPCSRADLRHTLDETPDEVPGFDPAEPYIVVGGSAAFSRTPLRWRGLRPAYAELCRRLMTMAQVVVSGADGPDDEILRPLAKKMELPYIGPMTPTQRAVDILGNAALYVGGRWHPSIMALSGGTPIIALSSNSDFKARGILDLAGLEQAPIPAFRIGGAIDAIAALAAHHLDDPAGRARRLDLVQALREAAIGNVRFLRAPDDVRRSCAPSA